MASFTASRASLCAAPKQSRPDSLPLPSSSSVNAAWPRAINGLIRSVARCTSATAAATTAAAAVASSVSSASSCYAVAQWTPRRLIIVPRQLKAYGGTFSQSIGERSDHLPGHLTLQSLSPSRTANSPLLSRPVKQQTIDSFSEMLITPVLQEALANLKITTPSPIQQTAIEAILQGKNTVVAAPHGEGKTLAFLLPLYQNMMRDRDVLKIPLRERRPRLILLAPTRELLEQLQSVCATLDAATGLRSIQFSSRKRSKYHLSRLIKQTMADVVVMDPKLVLRLLRARRLFLDDLRYLAMDEADAMLSSLHDHDATHLLLKVQKRNQYRYLWPVQTQYVFSTAYMTRKLEYVLGRRVENVVTCLNRATMHRPTPRLRHRFYAIQREPEKFTVLLHLLRKNGHLPVPVDTDEAEIAVHTHPRKLDTTLAEWRAAQQQKLQQQQSNSNEDSVESETWSAMVEEVEDIGPAVVDAEAPRQSPVVVSATDMAYSEDMAARYALEALRPLSWEYLTTVAAPFSCPIPRTVFGEGKRVMVFFRSIDAATAVYHQLKGLGFAVSVLHAALPWAVRRSMFADFASGRTNILCTTDVAGRGLDLHVDLVINFDVATNALLYLSRSGRAARMGRVGGVASLYTKHQGVIVSAIKAFLKAQLPLEGVSNQKAHMMTPRYAEWRLHKINSLARSYVSMITRKAIPAHLERTYVHHNATWRPIFHPKTTGQHGGVAPRQQQKLMDRVMEQAVWFRRSQLARRKGGRAKFGRRTMDSGVWNDIGGIASTVVANEAQDPRPAGPSFGPPSGPPR